MSEQTANLCTTDACESLRARLAKYEDAEGRPVGVVGADRESIRRQLDAFVAWPGSDHSTVTTTTCLLFAEQIAALFRAEYATKSQGVVLPERLDFPHRDEFESADQYAAAIGEAKKWNACLDEVARLNSSPASAGGVYSADPLACSGCVSGCFRCRVSAGGLDERDFAAVYAAGDKLYNELRQWLATEHDADSQAALESWRAALTASAPSHGEQVRQMVPDAFLEVARKADDVLTAIIRNNEPLATLERTYGKDWHEAVGKIRTALILQIAAAPSAGSHGGDV